MTKLSEHCGPDLAAHQEVIKATVESRTVQGAQDHCQSLGMDLFSPVNPGQVQKLRDLGFPSETNTLHCLMLMFIYLHVPHTLLQSGPFNLTHLLKHYYCLTVKPR